MLGIRRLSPSLLWASLSPSTCWGVTFPEDREAVLLEHGSPGLWRLCLNQSELAGPLGETELSSPKIKSTYRKKHLEASHDLLS